MNMDDMLPRKPIVNRNSPLILEMEPGEYWWCACGRSKSQPFCDGSHKGTGLEPMMLKIEEPRRVAWCACKHSARQPFCDGSHKQFRPEQVGTEI